jgi:GMP synthase-like glutamine amidotransferase
VKIHCIQHVEFETLGTISEWIEKRKHYLSTTRLHENEYFPKMEDLDLLIIMGGPMNIYEHEKYPWLGEEKKFIKEVISAGKAVIGICLGAQLIADILKAEVFKNDYIGHRLRLEMPLLLLILYNSNILNPCNGISVTRYS